MKLFQNRGGSKSKLQSTLPRDLGLVILITFLSIIFVLVPPFNQTPLRIPFALPLLLFIPGYSFVSLLFPRKEDLTGIERLTLSIVLSIALVIFDGFALHYTPWGFRPAPIVLSLSAITLLLVLITLVLRIKIPVNERYLFDYHAFLKSLKAEEKSTTLEKALVVALVASIIIASGIVIYGKRTFPEETFTAFYLLDTNGKAENYMTDLYLGRQASVTVGIENHEHTTVNYILEAKLEGSTVNSQDITLGHGENWLGNVSFIVNRVGPRVKLEFLLYKDGSTDPYRSLHLWVVSHIDYENPEILKKYTLAHPPEIKNGDMKLASGSDWNYLSNNRYFKGVFFNPSSAVPPETTIIRGHIIDTVTGLPIAKASIEISNHYGYENRTLSDESGYYELKAIADHLWLEAWTSGYKQHSTEFAVADGQTLALNISLERLPLNTVALERLPTGALQLPPEGLNVETLPPDKQSPPIPTLKGYVTDEVTDFPVANAHVSATNYRGFTEYATTNERGYFDMRAIPEYLEIGVQADGYMRNVTAINIVKERTTELKLTPEHSAVNGYIFNEVGEPVANANIRIGDHIEHDKQSYYDVAVSNEMGYYEIRTIAGPMWLDASKNDYFANGMEFDIAYGATKQIDLRLAPMPAENAKVSGYVFHKDTRTGLGGVKVIVGDYDYYERSTFTDGNGYYEIYTVPGHLWLDIDPEIYSKSIELDVADGQPRSVNITLDASPLDTYEIYYPSNTRSEYGYYGAIYQDIVSEGGIAILSFKVKDSYTKNKNAGYHFKQVLLNDVVLWEDDVAGDEGWHHVQIPITLGSGVNRITLRVYEKQGVGAFSVHVWWDDVRLEPITTLIDMNSAVSPQI
jgi:uncharacterized membrane protein